MQVTAHGGPGQPGLFGNIRHCHLSLVRGERFERAQTVRESRNRFFRSRRVRDL